MYTVFPFAAALLFVLQSLLLKRVRGGQREALVLHASYMLLVGAACLVVWAGSGSFEVSPATVGVGLFYGIDFSLTMIVYARALATGPLSYSSFFFSASMLIPVVASSLFWQERLSAAQGIGLVLFLVSFYFILVLDGKGRGSRPQRIWYLYALAAFVLNGLMSVFGKLHQTTVGGETVAFLGIGFLVASAVAILGALVRFGGIPNPTRSGDNAAGIGSLVRSSLADKASRLIVIGIAMTTGIGNALVIWLTPKLPGAFLFSSVNGSIVVGLLLVSRFIYGEKLSLSGWLGAGMGVTAIILVSV